MGHATCHPDRPRHAKGLCYTCYYRDYYHRNRERKQAQQRERHKAYYHEKVRDAHFRKKYGMSWDEVRAWADEIGWLCQLCGHEMDPVRRRRYSIVVDHDHATGEVRGLLCARCNNALGALGDTLEGVELARAYLRKVRTGRDPARPLQGLRP